MVIISNKLGRLRYIAVITAAALEVQIDDVTGFLELSFPVIRSMIVCFATPPEFKLSSMHMCLNSFIFRRSRISSIGFFRCLESLLTISPLDNTCQLLKPRWWETSTSFLFVRVSNISLFFLAIHDHTSFGFLINRSDVWGTLSSPSRGPKK